MPDPRTLLRRGRRALLRRRRLLVAALVAVAAMAFARQVSPAPPPHTSVVVAAHDLDAGVTLSPDDVRMVDLPAGLVPAAATSDLAAVIGETVAGPMREGEVMTDRRVVAPSLVAGYPAGSLATPLRVRDASVVSLLEVGDQIDVYAAVPDDSDSARLLVTDAPVLALPAPEDRSLRADGGLVVLAVDAAAAARLAQAAETAPLSVALRD